jgi:alanyl-tRNA synthetase
MSTERLYHADSFLREFTARVVAHGAHRGRASVILDRTAFYPEAGGQMADRGTLAGAAIADVQVDDDGTIHHVLVDGAAAPAEGAEVSGAIDWPRRRQHMAQHTGQHMLSAALVSAANAPTASARLGDSACTIDVERDRLLDLELVRAEDLANAIVDDDLAIRAWFPDPAELAALPLRREPKVDARVRVIAIGDFDYSPCGGTHCARTAQVGSLRVLGTERYKGMTRITFAAGAKARAELVARDAALRGLAAGFTCAPAEVATAVDKLRRDLAGARDALKEGRERLAELTADALLASGGGPIAACVPGDAELLRAIAARVTAAGRDALLAATSPDGVAVLFARAAGSALDCGKLLGALAKQAGGRGGGRPERAEGRLPAGAVAASEWPALVASITVVA